jgi:purine-binding chemotaxis protein CheW
MNEAMVAGDCQYLTFFVSREEYAIDVLRVREVVGIVPVTRVPSTPEDVRGVVNLRGSVVPVIDLGRRFGAGELTTTRRTCIVVVQPEASTDRVVGLLVDSVNRVVTLAPSAVVPVPPFGTTANAAMLAGMGIVGGAFVLILVPERAARIEDREEKAS